MGGWKLFKEFDELNMLVATGLGFSLFFLYKNSNSLMVILNSFSFSDCYYFLFSERYFTDNLSLVSL